MQAGGLPVTSQQFARREVCALGKRREGVQQGNSYGMGVPFIWYDYATNEPTMDGTASAILMLSVLEVSALVVDPSVGLHSPSA